MTASVEWREAAHPYRAELSRLAVLNLLVAAMTLGLPWLVADVFGAALAGNGPAGIQSTLLLAPLASATALLGGLAAYRTASADARIAADIQQRSFDHVQRLPLAFHEGRGKGDLLALIMFEALRLARFLTTTVAATPARLLTILGSAIIMVRIDSRLGLVIPILVPVLVLVSRLVGRGLRHLAEAHQRAEARAMELAEESLEMLAPTKAFAREERQLERFAASAQEVAALKVRQARVSALADPLVLLLAAAVSLVVLVAAGASLRAGEIALSELVRLSLYAGLLVAPVKSLTHLYGEYQYAFGALDRLRTVLAEPTEPDSGRTPRSTAGAIRFERIGFAFPGRPPLFRDLTLDIAAGERVALTGANGAGKTSLINLLLRFYQLDEGRILLDGADIAGLDLAALRRRVGLVPQVTRLFNGSIRDNIAFGVDDPPTAAIERAAALAQAAEFIARLPQGYDTVVGDCGVRLSGGQRQRLALARALLTDPAVLILDEATAMFDDTAEAAFVADFRAALEGRTVLFTSHRPAMLALADREIEILAGTARESQRTTRRRA